MGEGPKRADEPHHLGWSTPPGAHQCTSLGKHTSAHLFGLAHINQLPLASTSTYLCGQAEQKTQMPHLGTQGVQLPILHVIACRARQPHQRVVLHRRCVAVCTGLP